MRTSNLSMLQVLSRHLELLNSPIIDLGQAIKCHENLPSM